MAGAPLRLRRHPEVVNDLQRLPEPVAIEALRIIKGLATDPRRGGWLALDERTGDLSDCRKILFGPDEDGFGPSYRIVYRLRPDNQQPEVVDLVAIGEKRRFRVYLEAAARLERDPRRWWSR